MSDSDITMSDTPTDGASMAAPTIPQMKDAVRRVCATSYCPMCLVAALTPAPAANQVRCQVCGLTGHVAIRREQP